MLGFWICDRQTLFCADRADDVIGRYQSVQRNAAVYIQGHSQLHSIEGKTMRRAIIPEKPFGLGIMMICNRYYEQHADCHIISKNGFSERQHR